MMERIKEVTRSAWHWVLAGVIATTMASAGISVLYAKYENEWREQPCVDRACFSQLDERVTALELKLAESD
jgi:hypothetical protein